MATFRLSVNVHVTTRIGIQIKCIKIAEDIPISTFKVTDVLRNIPCALTLAFAGAAGLHRKDNVLDDGLESGVDAASFLGRIVKEHSAALVCWFKEEHVTFCRKHFVNSCGHAGIHASGSEYCPIRSFFFSLLKHREAMALDSVRFVHLVGDVVKACLGIFSEEDTGRVDEAYEGRNMACCGLRSCFVFKKSKRMVT